MSERKKILALAVTGSIAAHKAIDIASQLTQAGVDVRVILSEEAQRFVTELPFKTLSRNPVITSLYDEDEGWKPTHITLADEADVLLVAPTTANTIAKLALGLAGDALGCVALALNPQAQLMIAPAMNGKMWNHPATQQHVQTLRERGALVIDPESGLLSCGYEGVGRLAPVDNIVSRALSVLNLPSTGMNEKG